MRSLSVFSITIIQKKSVIFKSKMTDLSFLNSKYDKKSVSSPLKLMGLIPQSLFAQSTRPSISLNIVLVIEYRKFQNHPNIFYSPPWVSFSSYTLNALTNKFVIVMLAGSSSMPLCGSTNTCFSSSKTRTPLLFLN